MPDLRDKRVLVTGGGGFLGRRLVAKLAERGADPIVVRAADYDLTEPGQVVRALEEAHPDLVLHAAAVVGGIGANRDNPGRFFYENAVMGIHLIHEAMRAGIEKMLVVGTVCSYPKFTPTPFSEDDLWNGYPEETNAPYGLAKKMLLAQAQAYRAQYGFNCVYLIPTNLYGPGDNFDLHTSHVIPAMIRKFSEARASGSAEVVLWGTGSASREFLYVDDAAEGLLLGLEGYDGAEPLNLGANHEISIKDLATRIAEVTGFDGRIVWDDTKPDGQPRRSVDGSRARDALGWTPQMQLDDGLRATTEWYLHEVEATSASARGTG
jgi:GDP-L-fucose synthase